jgi:Holliday junction resolvase-like predicted endonuclease
MNTTQKGNRAEKAVADYLKKQGHRIIVLNWKVPSAEIDIVSIKGKTVYFTEVKYRTNTSQGDGFDYITDAKLHHMERAAELWVQTEKWRHGYELLAASVIANELNTFEISIVDIN